MQTLTTPQARELRRYARTLRKSLAPWDLWPRDARAWARRDRINALLVQLETAGAGAPRADPTVFMELDEWVSREFDFVRGCPALNVPADWTRRERSPIARPPLRPKSRCRPG